MSHSVSLERNSSSLNSTINLFSNSKLHRLNDESTIRIQNNEGHKKVKYRPDSDRHSSFDAIRSVSSVIKMVKNDTLFNEGERADHFYEVIFGHIKTYTLLSDGRRHITNFYSAGDIIGLPQEERYSFSAQAITRSNVRKYSFTEMNKNMPKSPLFSAKILTIMEKELKKARILSILLACKSPEEKVATFLLNYNYCLTHQQDYEAIIYLPMSLADIADHLGMAQETICRILGKYRQLGLLKYKSLRKQREIYISSVKSLAHHADMLSY